MPTDGYSELASDLTVDTTAHLASLSRLQADHALVLGELTAAQTDLIAARSDDALAAATIAALEAEVERLEDLLFPPAATRRILESYLVQGGGGFDWIEALVQAGGIALVCGTDVGAHVYFPPESWEGLKWNAGTSMRHCASGTIDPRTGEVISAGGSPGSQEGTFALDTLAQDWNGPIPGSLALRFNSQNSDGWGFGYGGNFEQRSVGRLCWRRANGDLVAGQFGYAKPGGSGVAILANGLKRVIAGTENWAVRGVQRLTDAVYVVSVEKARSADTALPTPGGLWVVDVEAGTLERRTEYPETPEHIDSRGDSIAVACRDAGIWRDGKEITGNLPRASEWYSIALRSDGAIIAGCMNPVMVNGRSWAVATLEPGASVWVNRTPPPRANKDDRLPTLNSQEPFIAVNWENTLGNPGATVMDVAWRGDVPVCSASGIVWGAPNGGVMQPAPGSWIIVNKSYDRTRDGYEAVAESDFRAHYRKPGKRWERVKFAGGNEGAEVAWVAHVLHYRGVDGTRQTFNADTGTISTTSVAMPPQNPQADMTAATRAAILQSMEVQQFGSRTGTFALDAETLIIWGHGGAISRVVPTE